MPPKGKIRKSKVPAVTSSSTVSDSDDDIEVTQGGAPQMGAPTGYGALSTQKRSNLGYKAKQTPKLQSQEEWTRFKDLFMIYILSTLNIDLENVNTENVSQEDNQEVYEYLAARIFGS